MPKSVSVQNNFLRGLITEATGLNFPENACTETSNCVFTLIGDVTRRLGINLEKNFQWQEIPSASSAVASFKWTNAGGDGETELLVLQVGNTLYFFTSSASTVLDPLSTNLLVGTVNIPDFQATGNTSVVSVSECQFASGNGYLFVYHPDCDPFYCTYSSGVITGNLITVQIRDFNGYYPEPGNPTINTRPVSLTNEHNYNLQNQGWSGSPKWAVEITGLNGGAYADVVNNNTGLKIATGALDFVTSTGLSITGGQTVTMYFELDINYSIPYGGIAQGSFSVYAYGIVVSYNSGTGALIIDVIDTPVYTLPTPYIFYSWVPGGSYVYMVSGADTNRIATFASDVNLYPSNTDIWFEFKNSSGNFDPSTTYSNVGITTTPAPRGYFILNAFNQNQTGVSSISGLTNVVTTARPSTGAWFQGRVWYAGINSSQAPSGDQGFYTWTENIYFSQIIRSETQFGMCFQTNDPTNENLFDILPTDGGVITIQGCGNINRLFPIQNGMLVFANNGVWFITGSSGIGFTATDYTITKISSVKSLSSTSFIDVMGLPFFWNEEGIYRVVPAQGQGIGLLVEPLTIGTILSFYNKIPLDSKTYARGDYDPINYVIKWVYRSTQESGIQNRYQYDSVLIFNTYLKAFYTYSISPGPAVSGLFYMNYPNSVTAPLPSFKYVTTFNNKLSFSEENDSTYVDWASVSAQSFTSYFTTGYSLHGKGVLQWQPAYVWMFSRNTTPWAYTIQGSWDYSINNNSGKNSSIQTVVNGLGQPNFGMLYRRHKIRGHGHILQFTVSSVPGQPFDIMGWTMLDQIDAGI